MRNDTGAAGRFDGDTFWARSASVGLKGGAGTLTLWRNTTSLFVNTLLFNAFGDSFGFSPAIRQTFTSGGAVQVSGDTGWSDSVKYASPNVGGLSFTGHDAAAEGVGGHNLGVSALYFGGPFAGGFAWQRVEKGVGAFNPDTTAKVIGLGADYTLGAGKLMVQWNKQSPDVGADLTTLSIGYGHTLSKRSDLYAVTMHEKKTGLSNGNSDALGVRHRF